MHMQLLASLAILGVEWEKWKRPGDVIRQMFWGVWLNRTTPPLKHEIQFNDPKLISLKWMQSETPPPQLSAPDVTGS